MRLVHLSDLHLGFRQYQRLTPRGINQREADVAQSFTRAIDKIIELAPEIVADRRRHVPQRAADEPGDPARVPAVRAAARARCPTRSS